MMWKCQVSATSMDVDLRTKVTHRHCTTFYMPAGSSRTPRAGPGWFSRSLRLPEDKIKRIYFMRIIGEIPSLIGDSKHGLIITKTDCASHDAKLRVLTYTEIDIALTLISKSKSKKSQD